MTTNLTGNLTREPEIRYTSAGMPTTTLGLAVNRKWQDNSDGSWHEEASFFDVVCFGELAENVALSLTKGMRVNIEGRLQQNTWVTDDGAKRSKVEIVASEVSPSLRYATALISRIKREWEDEDD